MKAFLFFFLSMMSRNCTCLLNNIKTTSPTLARRILTKLHNHDQQFDNLIDSVLDGEGAATRHETQRSDWRKIDWQAERKKNDYMIAKPSPVDVISIGDRIVYVKRDDQLRLSGSQISGNKARKMLALHELDPVSLFPSCLVSYGGPQSNAMLSLAAIVNFKNQQSGFAHEDPRRRRFVYYTKKLPRFLRNQPSGNLYRAMSLGIEIIELPSQEYENSFGSTNGGSDEAPQHIQPPVVGDSLFIPQGGASSMAAAGTHHLAAEIYEFCRQKNRRALPWVIVVPGGTCTTALLVHRALLEINSECPDHEKLDIVVAVVPCVGDECKLIFCRTSLR